MAITSNELRARGMYDDILRRAKAREPGAIHLRRGLFLLGDPGTALDVHRELIKGTVPVLGEQAVVSHVSAAVLHALPVLSSWLKPVWVTEQTRVGSHNRAWLHTFRTQLADRDCVIIDRIRVTSIERTCIDLARYLRQRDSVPVLDAALRQGVDRDALLHLVQDAPHVPGNRGAKWAIRFADPRSESFGEGASRVVLHDLDLPEPEIQREIFDHNGVFVARSDFRWDKYGTVGEFDGMDKYDQLAAPGVTPRDVLLAEKDRDERLRDALWWPVHWWWSNLAKPQALKVRLLRAFESGSRLRRSGRR